MSIKPYITVKNLLIFLVIAFITSYGNKSHTPSITLFMMFTTLYAMYPFAVGDQSGIDSLYSILGISRKDVVRGRYAFLLVMNLVGIILGMSIYFILSIIFKTPIFLKEALLASASSMLVLSINQFIQYPILFKNGYFKSASFTFLPLMVIGLIAVLSVQFFKGKTLEFMNNAIQFFISYPVLGAFIILIIWIVLLFISYRKSYKYYIRREF